MKRIEKHAKIALFILLALLTAYSLITFAQEDPGMPDPTDVTQPSEPEFAADDPNTWDSTNIAQVPTDQLIQNPQQAIELWDSIDASRKEEVFSDSPESFQAFSEKADEYFSQTSGKPIEGLGTVPGITYSNGILDNGGASLDPRNIPADILGVRATEQGFKYILPNNDPDNANLPNNEIDVTQGTITSDGTWDDGSGTPGPRVEFSGSGQTASLGADGITMSEGTSLISDNNQIRAGQDDFTVTRENGNYVAQGIGFVSIALDSETVMEVNFQERISFNDQAQVSAQGAQAQVSRNGVVEQRINGRFEYDSGAVVLEHHYGVPSTFEDDAVGIKVSSVLPDQKTVVAPFGSSIPENFRDIDNQVSYDNDNLLVKNMADVTRGDMHVRSESQGTLFQSIGEGFSARGQLTYEDDEIAYEGRTDSTRFTKAEDGKFNIVATEDRSPEEGGIASITKKVQIGDLDAEEFITGESGINFIVSREDGNLDVSVDSETLLAIADIEKTKSQFALIENEFDLTLGDTDARLTVNTDKGILYTAADGEEFNVGSSYIVQRNLGTDLETAKGIVEDMAETDPGTFDIQQNALKRIYSMRVGELSTTDADDTDRHFEAQMTSFEETKEFIADAYSDETEQTAAMSSFMLQNLGDVKYDYITVRDAEGKVSFYPDESQGEIYNQFVSQNVGEIRQILEANPVLASYLYGTEKGNLDQISAELAERAQQDPESVQEYKSSIETIFQNRILYEKLADHKISGYEEDLTPITESYRALISLEDTSVSVEEGITITRESRTFSTRKLNLAGQLALEYTKAGDIGDAIAVMDQIDDDYNIYLDNLPPSYFEDPEAVAAFEGLQEYIDIQRDMVSSGAFNRIQLDLYTQQGAIEQIFQSRAGYTERVGEAFDTGSGLSKLGAVVFSGGFGKDIVNLAGGFDEVKRTASVLKSENQEVSRGIYGIQTLQYMGVEPEIIKAWIDGDLNDDQMNQLINSMMVKGKEPLGEYSVYPEIPNTILVSGGKPKELVYVNGEPYGIDPAEKQEIFAFLKEVQPDSRTTYYSDKYGDDIQKIVGNEQVAYSAGEYQASEDLDIDKGLQNSVFEARIASLEMSGAGKVLSFMDDGLSPGAVVIGAATGGIGGTMFGSATGLAGAGLGIAENTVIDMTAGTILVATGFNPEEHPYLASGIAVATGVLSSSTQRALKRVAMEAGVPVGQVDDLVLSKNSLGELQILGPDGALIPISRDAMESVSRSIDADAILSRADNALSEENLALVPDLAEDTISDLDDIVSRATVIELGEQIGEKSAYGTIHRISRLGTEDELSDIGGLVLKQFNNPEGDSLLIKGELNTAQNLRDRGVIRAHGVFKGSDQIGDLEGYVMDLHGGITEWQAYKLWLNGDAIMEAGSDQIMKDTAARVNKKGYQLIDPHTNNWMVEKVGTRTVIQNGVERQVDVYGNPKLIDLGGVQSPEFFAKEFRRDGIPDQAITSSERLRAHEIKNKYFEPYVKRGKLTSKQVDSVTALPIGDDGQVWVGKMSSDGTFTPYLDGDTGYRIKTRVESPTRFHIDVTEPNGLELTNTIGPEGAGQAVVNWEGIYQGAKGKLDKSRRLANKMSVPNEPPLRPSTPSVVSSGQMPAGQPSSAWGSSQVNPPGNSFIDSAGEHSTFHSSPHEPVLIHSAGEHSTFHSSPHEPVLIHSAGENPTVPPGDGLFIVSSSARASS